MGNAGVATVIPGKIACLVCPKNLCRTKRLGRIAVEPKCGVEIVGYNVQWVDEPSDAVGALKDRESTEVVKGLSLLERVKYVADNSMHEICIKTEYDHFRQVESFCKSNRVTKRRRPGFAVNRHGKPAEFIDAFYDATFDVVKGPCLLARCHEEPQSIGWPTFPTDDGASRAVPGAILVRPLVLDKRADALSVILSVRRTYAARGCWATRSCVHLHLVHVVLDIADASS